MPGPFTQENSINAAPLRKRVGEREALRIPFPSFQRHALWWAIGHASARCVACVLHRTTLPVQEIISAKIASRRGMLAPKETWYISVVVVIWTCHDWLGLQHVSTRLWHVHVYRNSIGSV